MKKSIPVLLLFSLLLTACGAPPASALATPVSTPVISAAPAASPTPAPAPSAAEETGSAQEGDRPLEDALAAVDGWALPEKSGVKYWLDTKEGLKLHCWFISEGPAYYESVYTAVLKKASYADGVLTVPQLRDRFGFPLRSLKELRLRFEEDAVTMEVDVDEAKLAGGAGDNLLAGSYRFVPWGKPCTPPVESKIVEPFGDLILPCNGFAHTENGVVRYWLETADGIRLRCWFVSEGSTYCTKIYTVPPAKAERRGDWIVCDELLDEQGQALPGLRAFSLQFREDSVLMAVTRNPQSLAGGTGDNLASGQTLFTPYSGSYLPPVLDGEPPVVSDYDGYTCTEDGNVRFWLESEGLRLNLTLHCFFPVGDRSVREQVWHIDADRAFFTGTTLTVEELLDSYEESVFDGYSAFSFHFAEGQVLMHVERDEEAEEGAFYIPEGDYLFLPLGARAD